MNSSGNLRPVRNAFLIGFVVFILGGLLWRTGLFQAAELWCYDKLVSIHAQPQAHDPRIVLILQDETDIKNLDYPLHDKVLSELLEKIETGQPTVVGIDLYRDLDEPRDHSEAPILAQKLKQYPNIISIFLYDTPQHPFEISPPVAVRDDPSRFGLNNLVFDHKTVRRAFLFEPDDCTYPSFAFILAQYYLAAQNVAVAQAGSEISLGRTIIPKFGKNEGGYVNSANGGYQFMQDFRGPTNEDGFTHMSISDALKLAETSIFKNKIVIVGANGTDSSNDADDTTIGQRVPGAVIHAQIVNQLLRAAIDGDRPTVGSTQTASWFWLGLWAVCGVVVGFFVRSHILFALAVAAGAGLIIAVAWLFFINSHWIVIFAPLVIFLASSMLVKAYAATYEEQQRENLMKLFSQRVSPALAEEIWNQRDTFLQGGRPAAQKITVTVLFTDLKNYSTISEGMSPAELIAWVNECQGALAKHVEKNRGIVNCFMGDGMMAVFGVPIPRQNKEEIAADACNAVRAALGMCADIRAMNTRWKAAGKPLAGLRVGIFTGPAVSGEIGTHDYLEYSVIGDTVNTASRLESVDKEGTMTRANAETRILIGALTHKYTSGQFSARHVGAVNLKGKTEITDIYNVLDSDSEEKQS